MMEPFVDAVMADNGFLIDSTLEEPALRRIAMHCSALHVERVIGRLKTYKILVHKPPRRMVPHFGQVVKILAAVTNLSAPILAENEFAFSDHQCSVIRRLETVGCVVELCLWVIEPVTAGSQKYTNQSCFRNSDFMNKA